MAPAYDAILIPGGGVREGGALPPWVRARLDLARERFRGEYLLALSAGTPHRPPPVTAAGYPVFESRAAAEYLIRRGAPAEKVLAEWHSYDTIGNAFFARTIHAAPAGWRRLLVITSAFHLPRAEAVFGWVFGLPAPGNGFELDFEASPDAGLGGEALELRLAKEARALAALPELAAQITTLAALHRWLFTRHGAYSAEGYARTFEPLSGPLADSY